MVKILLLSGNSSWEVVSETLRTGSHRYVATVDAGDELVTGLMAVRPSGQKFMCNGFADDEFD